MKKIISLISLFSIVLFTLAGCGHTHEFADATCTAAKTCTECGETEGEPLGHNWKEADCENPKTCTRCGETEGKSLGHKWEKADCEHPAKCTVCGETSGSSAGHTVDIGRCGKCGKVVNEDVGLEIANDLLDVNNNYVESAKTLINSANTSSLQDMYDKFTQAQSYLDNAYQEWSYILNTCNSYPSGTEEISGDISAVMSDVPSGVNGSSAQELINYLKEYKQFLEDYQELCQTVADFAEEMSN